MAVEKTRYTSREFRTFVNLPENIGKSFERIDGEVVEVMPSGIYASVVANLISRAITNHVIEHQLGYVSGEQGGYDVSDEDTFAPDVAFISKARQPTLPKEGYNPIPPDFVVEVVSPSDLKDPKRRVERKLEKYRAAKIPLMWYVYTKRKEIDVYVRGEKVRTVGINDTLDGGDVLPNFTLRVADIFPD